MDAGFSSTLIDIQYRKQLSQEPTAVVSTAETDGRLVQKSAVAIQALNNNSQKLVNWLLSSDQGKKENLCASTVRLLEVGEFFQQYYIYELTRDSRTAEMPRLQNCHVGNASNHGCKLSRVASVCIVTFSPS